MRIKEKDRGTEVPGVRTLGWLSWKYEKDII